MKWNGNVEVERVVVGEADQEEEDDQRDIVSAKQFNITQIVILLYNEMKQ